MSAAPAIQLKAVGKRYWISSLDVRRGVLESAARLFSGESRRRPLWALRDVSFELPRGEILGVIGPNGAGKSTLLLLLAGILGTTEGSLRVNGRTHLFFQLASGLQPRLTVLDNIYVCAALLGMPRRKLRKLLPSIIEFSGLKDYLHARFGELSTGLAARLSFATAVHADMDIVLADEMIAVGDEAFREKCFRTFMAFRKQGKTMVLSSHGMDTIENLATRVLYLNQGGVAYYGKPKEAIARFLGDIKTPAQPRGR